MVTGAARQRKAAKSAGAMVRAHCQRGEGLNERVDQETGLSLTARGAASQAETLRNHPDGRGRNPREDGAGASIVPAGVEHSGAETLYRRLNSVS